MSDLKGPLDALRTRMRMQGKWRVFVKAHAFATGSPRIYPPSPSPRAHSRAGDLPAQHDVGIAFFSTARKLLIGGCSHRCPRKPSVAYRRSAVQDAPSSALLTMYPKTMNAARLSPHPHPLSERRNVNVNGACKDFRVQISRGGDRVLAF